MLKILFFNTGKIPRADEIETLLDERLKPIDDLQLIFCRDFAGLSGHMSLHPEDFQVVVVLVSDELELHTLLELGELFEDVELIVILPREDPESINKAHLLAPRFLAILDNNIDDLLGILKKKIHLSKKEKGPM